MAWDFSTDPDFQKKLDWVDEFCREEVEPLDYVFPFAVRSKDPALKDIWQKLLDVRADRGGSANVTVARMVSARQLHRQFYPPRSIVGVLLTN